MCDGGERKDRKRTTSPGGGWERPKGMMSIEEKRALVYDLAKSKVGSPEMLQAWSRRDILELLRLETGKERKYTGLAKLKLVDFLLRVVAERDDVEPESMSPAKRGRKSGRPTRFEKERRCGNLACQATIKTSETFCRRCSCCICRKYDENKDPGLWLVCEGGDGACAASCHVECAILDKRCGIAGGDAKLDAAFYCVSCGKVNDLLGCWKKQLTVAKDARRVDVLCSRVWLAQRLLKGTSKFQRAQELVELAGKKLEQEVGSLNGIPAQMNRGIVNRLTSGAEAQRLCAAALAIVTPSHPLLLPPAESHEEPSSTIQTDSQKDSSNSTAAGKEVVVPAMAVPVTPSKEEGGMDRQESTPRETEGRSYEHCVKVVRWLEREGLIESGFRVKFLTWFSLKASAAERRVVRVFVDTMADDPSSLAGQLVDTFSETVHRKPILSPPSGFCTKLWH